MVAPADLQVVTLRIQRYDPDHASEAYFDSFSICLTPEKTILDALQEIKAEQDSSLTFRCSCRHGICGSCAMNVGGQHVLACETPLKDKLDSDNQITIRPLAHLPVIRDLVTDQTRFWVEYEHAKPWLITTDLPEKEFRVSPEELHSQAFAETCILCGACYSACPVVGYGNGFSGPHAILKSFLRIADSRDSSPAEHIALLDNLWACTSCYSCILQCPKALAPGAAAIPVRSCLVEKGQVPRSLGSALTSTFRNNNPFDMPHEDRTLWAGNEIIKNALEEPLEVLLLACCMNCYDPRAQKVAQAFVNILKMAGITVGTLGNEEACCGSEIRRSGEVGLFEMIAEERTKILSAIRAKQVIVLSPHCFDVYNNHYPDLPVPVIHYTQYLAELVTSGRIAVQTPVRKKVTYHDPCYLGIQNHIYDAPRALIQSIPDVEFVEMPRNRETSLCCGGGGGNMWMEVQTGLSHERVNEALNSGAEIIASACPFCLNMLDDAIKALGVDCQIVVKDVVELLSTTTRDI